jgi:hypothetical protein
VRGAKPVGGGQTLLEVELSKQIMQHSLNMKIQKYAIVECLCDNSPALVNKVNALVSEGWELYGATLSGAVRGGGTRLFQAMVIPVPKLRDGAVWVPATELMSGHWEVKKEGGPPRHD